MTEYTCTLPTPLKAQIKVGNKYEHAEIDTLYFKEPTARHCYIGLKQIKGYFMKCITQIQRQIPNQVLDGKTPVANQEGGEAEISAEAFLLFLSMDADICAKFYNTMQQMFCNGLVFLDAEKTQELKSSHLDTLDVEGLDTLIETYLDFFSIYFIPTM